MKRMLFVFLMCLPGLAWADLWDLYDGDGSTPLGQYVGQQGISCDAYNTMAGLRWRNKGGDWVDASGVPQGAAPFVTAALDVGTTAKRVRLDYTALVGAAGVIIRRDGGAVVRIATRESDTPPVLRLTMQDGSVIERPAVADASLQFVGAGMCSVSANQRAPVASVNPVVVMGFGALPADVARAELELTVLYVGNRTALKLYALSVPRLESTQWAPPAVESPEYLWRLTFDEHAKPCDKWWVPGLGNPPTAQWTQDGGLFLMPNQAGVWCASGDPVPVPAQGTNGQVKVERGRGAVGNGLMFVFHPTKLAFGTELQNPNLRKLNGGKDLDSAWLSYWVKFGEDFHGFAKCEGGKLPGFKGLTTHCAGSGMPGNGLCGWSLRQSFLMACDKANPAWGHIELYMYAYHGLQSGFTGNNWRGNEHALLELGRWYCIEQFVQVNTPGLADGVAQLYVDGALTVDRRNVYLRGERPAQGYGAWQNAAHYPVPAGAATVRDPFGRLLWSRGPYTAATELGISGVYMTHHGGGVTPPGKTAQSWLDEFSVSTHRAGCPARQ